MVMLVPVMILAALLLIGGVVGIGSGFEHFLAPVFGAAEVAEGAVEGASRSTEYLLMGVSVGVALVGGYLAYLLYQKRKDLPQKIADALGGFYQAIVNKYWIDEFYAAVFVKPLIDGSTRILWQGVYRGVIDDTVNDRAHSARHLSDQVRHMQTGN